MASTAATSPDQIDRIIACEHHDPFEVLGMHPVWSEGASHLMVRAFRPDATSVEVARMDTHDVCGRLEQRHPAGFFEGQITDQAHPFPYLLRVTYPDTSVDLRPDPYAFPPVLSDYDLHLITEGSHQNLYEKMGAHRTELNDIRGVSFVVWAPAARRVSIVGSFNRWDGRTHVMRARGVSGIWELFVPDLEEGALYKFEIKGQDGAIRLKTDPFAFRMEFRPQTAGIVHTVTDTIWSDDEWMSQRAGADLVHAPVSVYEVHLGSWRRNPEDNGTLDYRDLAHQLVDYAKEMGYTHLELLPVAEHPLDQSWGYQVLGYYAPTSRFGTPDDFQFFVNHCHVNGIGVLLDWVPAHFPSDDHGLARFDGTALYEHEDPRQGAHPDWGTLVYNYGRNEVSNFLIANALFWLDRYHIDGLRVDAVASMLYLDYSRKEGEWIPNRYGGRENLEAIDFIKQVNETVYARFPGVAMIAEESTSWPGVSRPTYLGGLGFGFKWNMGWMNDALDYVQHEPVHRKYHHDRLTFGLVYAFSENFILSLSHDEVVHGKRSLLDKMPGDVWQKRANLRAFLGFAYGHPGKKLIFMGGEFGQWKEWDAETSLDWHLLEEEAHRELQRFVKDLNALCVREPALYQKDFDPSGFEWIDFHDSEQSVFSFLRRAEDGSFVVVVCNFTPVPRVNYTLGVPEAGAYNELLNSDAGSYGGSNQGNLGRVVAERQPSHGQPCSITLTLPPLSTLLLRPE